MVHRKRVSQTLFPEEEPEFQVAPMIDVLLVLMTFFMSITSAEVLKTKTKLDIPLPVAPESKAKDSAPSEVVINITWDPVARRRGIVFEEKEMSQASELTAIIAARRGTRPYFRAVIRAAENVPYSSVQEVMAICAEAQIENITFSVLSRESARKTYKKTP
jgi:biopolymer transport protein ExbD